VLVFQEGGKPEAPENNPESKTRTNNKLNPVMNSSGYACWSSVISFMNFIPGLRKGMQC